MMKKYLHNNGTSEQERSHAVPETKQLGKNAINKFEEEKKTGKNLQDIENGNILQQEVGAINHYNNEVRHGQHSELWGNTEHNTIMTQFLNADGGVADEIVSSDTPESVDDRSEYHNSFTPLNVTNTENQVAFREGQVSSSEYTSITQSPRFLDLAETDSLDLDTRSVNNEEDLTEIGTMYPVGVLSEDRVSTPTDISATTGGDTFSSISVSGSNNNISLPREIPSDSHKRKREDDETDTEHRASNRRVISSTVDFVLDRQETEMPSFIDDIE